DRRQPPFGRAYWIIVAIEAIALFAGARLLSALGHPELGVAWVAVVVGTHFYALGRVFGLDRFHALATVVTLCGIGGFIAFFAAAPALIPVIRRILSGLVLLAFAMSELVPSGFSALGRRLSPPSAAPASSAVAPVGAGTAAAGRRVAPPARRTPRRWRDRAADRPRRRAARERAQPRYRARRRSSPHPSPCPRARTHSGAGSPRCRR